MKHEELESLFTPLSEELAILSKDNDSERLKKLRNNLWTDINLVGAKVVWEDLANIFAEGPQNVNEFILIRTSLCLLAIHLRLLELANKEEGDKCARN